MAATEGRLSRWSRLKQKGGADTGEETAVAEKRVQTEVAEAEADTLSARLPGGVQVRNFVPAMPPLAPEPEDGDDRFTRGIGHAVEEGADSEDSDDVVTASDIPDDTLFEGIEDEELTDEQKEVVAGLPPLETLTQESDFTPYMQANVPEFLKRKALRVLWRANPFFNFRDGLNDYDEDFNVVHKIIEETVGAYKVGRGHLSEDELQEMMPEDAKHAFDEDEEEDIEAEGDLAVDEDADATVDESPSEKLNEIVDIDEDEDDFVGDGDDDVVV